VLTTHSVMVLWKGDKCPAPVTVTTKFCTVAPNMHGP